MSKPIGIRAALPHLKAGDTIFVTLPTLGGAQKVPTYHLAKAGREIRPAAFIGLWKRLEAVGDGLFETQSYRLKADEADA